MLDDNHQRPRTYFNRGGGDAVAPCNVEDIITLGSFSEPPHFFFCVSSTVAEPTSSLRYRNSICRHIHLLPYPNGPTVFSPLAELSRTYEDACAGYRFVGGSQRGISACGANLDPGDALNTSLSSEVAKAILEAWDVDFSVASNEPT